jgi:hypothetical protein
MSKPSSSTRSAAVPRPLPRPLLMLAGCCLTPWMTRVSTPAMHNDAHRCITGVETRVIRIGKRANTQQLVRGAALRAQDIQSFYGRSLSAIPTPPSPLSQRSCPALAHARPLSYCAPECGAARKESASRNSGSSPVCSIPCAASTSAA